MTWCSVNTVGLPAKEGEAGVVYMLQGWSTETRQISLWLGKIPILRKACH